MFTFQKQDDDPLFFIGDKPVYTVFKKDASTGVGGDVPLPGGHAVPRVHDAGGGEAARDPSGGHRGEGRR